MRDLLVFGAVVLLLPTVFRRPFIGLLLFSWLAYMRPQDLCWGFARDMRFSFYVAVTMFVGWYVNESHKRRFFVPEPRTLMLVALAISISVSLLFAGRYHPLTARYYLEFIKIIAIAVFTLSQVDTRQRLRALLWVICGSLAFYSVKNGVMGILNGGATILRGPGGMLEDNNDFALALVMNIPLLFYLTGLEQKKWLRTAGIVAIFFTMVTVMLTHSRGGFVSMCATLGVIAWRSGKLVQAGLVVAALVIGFFVFAPADVQERVFSIGAGEEDSSIRSRLHSWGIALKMWMANPIWGVGLRNYQVNAEAFGATMGARDFIHVAHNSYLQIAAEGGTVSILIYMSLLLSVFVSAGWMRRVARVRPDLAWAGHYARMYEAVTVGFMVGSTFLNRGHFDLIYHFLSLVGCTVLVVKRQLARPPADVALDAEVGGEVPAGGPVRVRWRSPVAGGALPRWERLT